MNGWIWLLAWQGAAGVACALTAWALRYARRAPSRDWTALFLAASVALGLFGFVGWNVYQIHRCEKYDRCERAPAWVGDGLHELQRIERERDAGRGP